MSPAFTPRIISRLALALGLTAGLARADWRDEIGYTRLQSLVPGELPSATSAGIAQVEAPDDASNYAPDTASSAFTGKTFVLKSGASAANGHATTVGSRLYGNTTSLLPGATSVDNYDANDWVGANFLQTASSALPSTETRSVQNHSWISASGNADTLVTEINQRLDYAINANGFVSVVGMNNGNSTTLPQLLGQSYHTISVGLVNGGHSAGFTTLDGTGRIKPEIVAPDSLTSFATPMVAGAAGMLHTKLRAAPFSLTGADLSRTVKALLLASATKDTVPSWANTGTRPLDLRYGAGELNLYHAYTTLRAGRVSASASSAVPARAWAAESAAASSSKTYFFTIPDGSPPTPFSAALVWHRVVTTAKGIGPLAARTWSATLANLDLRLHTASGFTLGPELAASRSTVDNLELVYQSALAPGTYALVVENLSATATPYALAWHSLPAVTVTATTAAARELDGRAAAATFTRSGDTTLPLYLPINYSGTAVAGVDYAAAPASIVIPSGSSSASLSITPIPDALAQGTRTLTVAVAADFGFVHDSAETAALTIEDKPADAWRFAHFSTAQLNDAAISGLTADPDHDGLTNLLEYALGGDPLAPDAASRSPAAGLETGDRLTLAYFLPAGRADLTYTVEWTADLAGGVWQTGAGYVTETGRIATTVDATPGDLVTVRAEARLADAPRQFLRLRVTHP